MASRGRNGGAMAYAPNAEVVPTLVELGRDECLELLGTATIGRVVLSVHCIPVAVPVNLSVIDGNALFTTDVGSKLRAAVLGQVVSVEADDVDRTYHTGWSVLLTGVAQIVSDPETIRQTRRAHQAWAPGAHPFLVKVPSTVISGRRLEWAAR